jgi:HSP20 family protein
MEVNIMANKSGTALAPMRGLRDLASFDPFRQMQERFNRVFGENVDFFKPTKDENWSLSTWAPACDIYENENEIVVKAELPEVKKEDVQVAIENNVLSIRGERKFSEFMRSFTLPSFVDASKVNAEFKDGLLRVTMPKREEAKPKQIEVKVK